jgi:phage portal protein BeeE
MRRVNKETWRVLPPDVAGDGIRVAADQVCHSYFADPSDPNSVISPLVMCAKAVLADEAIESSQYQEFKNGPMPKLALIAGDTSGAKNFSEDPDGNTRARPVRLEPHQRRQIITWYQQQVAGMQKFGLPVVLDSVIQDLKVLSRKPNEMGYQESGRYTKENIFESIGVSKILTGELDGTNRAGGELAESLMVDNTLNPMITLFGQALTKTFGPLYSAGKNDLVVWMEEAKPRQDEILIEKWRIGTRYYSVTRNEVRTGLLGLPPREGMDDILTPQTMEEREPDEDIIGVGRIPKPAPVAAPANGKQLLNGRH